MKRTVMNIRDSYVIGPNVKKKQKKTATPENGGLEDDVPLPLGDF